MTVTAPSRSVPLLDLKAQYEQIETEIMDALREVCASQRFILGPRVQELEERIAVYVGCQHGVGVSSGTDALLVALMALGVRPGDEVITTPFSFFATAGAVVRLGARPLFSDIDPVTFNLSADSVADTIATHCESRGGVLVNRRTGGRVKGLMPVHLFGQMADMDGLLELAARHRLAVVEDAAQAIGAADDAGRRAGSVGHIACFSFFPSKNLGAFGDAGMCTTNDAELAARMKALRAHGAKRRYHHDLVGGNFRLDALQAAVLLVKLRHLDDWTARRQANARWYDAELEGRGPCLRVVTPLVRRGYRHVFNQYVLRAAHRDTLRAHLADADIGTEVYYPVALHMQPCFADLGYQPDDCPESRRATAEALAIPIYPELSAAQRQHVVDTVSAFYRVP
jgi:dTDP-4-amino-4,6-dideoxygalactose transaminase